MSEWRHKDEWKKRGTDFLVMVTRHSGVDPYTEITENKWCVYGFIYPEHPHFASFSGPNIWQDAASVMPLHCGASLLEYPMYDGKVTSVKVGADYSHLHDERFLGMATKQEAYQVFSDAQDLFDWLQSKTAGEQS